MFFLVGDQTQGPFGTNEEHDSHGRIGLTGQADQWGCKTPTGVLCQANHSRSPTGIAGGAVHDEGYREGQECPDEDD